MLELLLPSGDVLLASLLTCLLIRETMIVILPNDVAGPGGRLINTGAE